MKSVMRIFMLLLLVFYGGGHCGFFSSSLDKIKKKAKDAYKKNQNKGKTLNFLGYDQSEYPGTKEKYREENRLKWEEYYECLKAQDKRMVDGLTPEAVIGFETSYISFDCKICLSPSENHNKDSITWDWAPIEAASMNPIEYTEHILLSPEDRSLKIYNLKSEHSGQYSCRMETTAVAPYFLTVVNISETLMDEVRPPSAPRGPHPRKPEQIDDGGNQFVLDTEWGEWSSCSKCGEVGKRNKLGYCNVYYGQLDNKEPDEVYNGSSELKELFKIFKYGIPCHSHILPVELKENPAVQARKNEIMMGFCQIKCPENKVFEVRDAEGKVIERVNNSEGIYSLRQQLPPLEPPVERRTQYEVKGKDVILECPGNINSDVPVQWQIGDKNLIAEKIVKESHGRIYISITDRIHIKKSKISDSNVYSCWQQKELAGTIRLVVEKKFQLNFNHTIMLTGVVLILGTFLYVFVKVMANRELTTK
ncbi:uncharacterized protein LOC126734672 isoform X1 [Anthonomus grandis grandis]|uniref:uncharacterized protein LOC126734672 isoform X1 n=1 Tax=Anthonomus grandis grandis TaxID=2921223 RepID=UPI002165E70F|nr:uncharacterized protein LOC126734672 isoform X1 [Anthonomus grandis grandis]